MTLANVVTDAELQVEFPTASTSDLTLLRQIRDNVEAMARAYVRHDITQPSSDYVEFHPRRNRMPNWYGGGVVYDVSGDKAVVDSTQRPSNILVLNQKFVRTITSVWEDCSAYFGKGSGDFADSTKLTEGVDFVLDQKEPDFSTTGRLIRIGRSWPSSPGTVKVQYTAGLTSSDLEGEYRFIKLALLDEIDIRYRARKEFLDRSGPGGGIMAGFSVRSDFTERYDPSVIADMYRHTLLPGTRRKLQSIRHKLVWI